jgi:hypothetical protein
VLAKLFEIIDLDRNGKLQIQELHAARENPKLARAMSRMIVQHQSEWRLNMDRWTALDSFFETRELSYCNYQAVWNLEKERIGNLAFWDDVYSGQPNVNPQAHPITAGENVVRESPQNEPNNGPRKEWNLLRPRFPQRFIADHAYPLAVVENFGKLWHPNVRWPLVTNLIPRANICNGCCIHSNNTFVYAMLRLGNMYYSGKGVEQNYLEAFKWSSDSVSENALPKDFNIDDEDTKFAIKKYPEVLKWGLKEVEQENTRAQIIVLRRHIGNRELSRKLAEQGIAEAQFVYGKYTLGCGRSTDSGYLEAVNWFKKAANQGNSEAQLLLGRIYDSEQIKSEAIKWLVLAAKNESICGWMDLKRIAIVENNPEAQFALGELFREGCCFSVKKNKQNALKLFQMAADQGYEPAKQAIEEFYKARGK